MIQWSKIAHTAALCMWFKCEHCGPQLAKFPLVSKVQLWFWKRRNFAYAKITRLNPRTLVWDCKKAFREAKIVGREKELSARKGVAATPLLLNTTFWKQELTRKDSEGLLEISIRFTRTFNKQWSNQYCDVVQPFQKHRMHQEILLRITSNYTERNQECASL